jgi:hypothetical protein
VQLETALAHYRPGLTEASMEHVHKHLRIIKNQMFEELATSGVELVRLAGYPYDEVKTLAEVEGWLHLEGP